MTLAAAVALDLWARPDDRVRPPGLERIEVPGLYAELRDQPPGVVAEYPLEEHFEASFYQQYHGHPITTAVIGG